MKALSSLLWIGLLLFQATSAWADVDLTAPSLDRAFDVRVFPRDGEVLVGRYHQWIIQVTDANRNVVDNASMTVAGGMEAHGHGLPSKPQITRYLGNGQYLIEGMLFNMAGRWTLLFVIQTPQVMDRVRFDFDIEF